MRLIVWNSQGANGPNHGSKWDILVNQYIAPYMAPQTEPVIGLLVESGWAPWVVPGEVVVNNAYWYPLDKTYIDPVASANSVFCQQVDAKRLRKALWVPWVNNLDAMKTNTRCSMGGILLPTSKKIEPSGSFVFEGHKRPTLRFLVGKNQGLGRMAYEITVLLVHLLSGGSQKTINEMFHIVDSLTQLIPEGTSGLVVGDMNVDLKKWNLSLPKGWTILQALGTAGSGTQQSGGILDYALLYDPNRHYQNSTATVLQQYKSGQNESDHSVLMYDIPGI